jgi:hypothetical protein
MAIKEANGKEGAGLTTRIQNIGKTVNIETEEYVNSLHMSENLKVGLMVAEHRKKCIGLNWPFDYYAFGFGQSPFQVPPQLDKFAQGECRQRALFGG